MNALSLSEPPREGSFSKDRKTEWRHHVDYAIKEFGIDRIKDGLKEYQRNPKSKRFAEIAAEKLEEWEKKGQMNKGRQRLCVCVLGTLTSAAPMPW